MLGKLIKHEFKTTGRYILLIMAILVIITPFAALYLRYSGKLINWLNISSGTIHVLQNLFSGICIAAYIVALIGVGAITGITLIYRFYKSMISSEGYLTHTLPVKTSSILISKGFVALVWSYASLIIIILSLLVFTKILGAWTMEEAIDSLSLITHQLSKVGINYGHLILFLIAMLIQSVNSIAMLGACFGIGHRMSGHPVLGTIVSYIGISFIIQIFTSTLMAVIVPLLENVMANIPTIGMGMTWFLIGINIYNIVLTAIFSVITVYMFKNKLNI